MSGRNDGVLSIDAQDISLDSSISSIDWLIRSNLRIDLDWGIDIDWGVDIDRGIDTITGHIDIDGVIEVGGVIDIDGGFAIDGGIAIGGVIDIHWETLIDRCIHIDGGCINTGRGIRINRSRRINIARGISWNLCVNVCRGISIDSGRVTIDTFWTAAPPGNCFFLRTHLSCAKVVERFLTPFACEETS
jgi:hypothetical protein